MTDLTTISARLAFKGAPGLVPHGAARGVILSFTRALSLEAAPHGARANAIAPGPIDTAPNQAHGPDWRMVVATSWPAGRRGVPENCAATALLLAGKGGDIHLGACLTRNGGEVMR